VQRPNGHSAHLAVVCILFPMRAGPPGLPPITGLVARDACPVALMSAGRPAGARAVYLGASNFYVNELAWENGWVNTPL
jgi:hypothetical protein